MSFDYGTRVRLKATALAGSGFRGWSGACTGHRACTITLDAAQSVRAKFVKLKR